MPARMVHCIFSVIFPHALRGVLLGICMDYTPLHVGLALIRVSRLPTHMVRVSGSNKHGYRSYSKTCKPLGNACELHIGRRCNASGYTCYSSAFHFVEFHMCVNTATKARSRPRLGLLGEHYTMAAFVSRWPVLGSWCLRRNMDPVHVNMFTIKLHGSPLIDCHDTPDTASQERGLQRRAFASCHRVLITTTRKSQKMLQTGK